MVIYSDNTIEMQSHRPNENWTGRHDVVVIDDNNELAVKVVRYSPFFERVLDENGQLIDITPTDRPPDPQPKPTQEDYLLDLDLRLSMLELGF